MPKNSTKQNQTPPGVTVWFAIVKRSKYERAFLRQSNIVVNLVEETLMLNYIKSCYSARKIGFVKRGRPVIWETVVYLYNRCCIHGPHSTDFVVVIYLPRSDDRSAPISLRHLSSFFASLLLSVVLSPRSDGLFFTSPSLSLFVDEEWPHCYIITEWFFYINHFSLIIFYHSVWLGFELFGS